MARAFSKPVKPYKLSKSYPVELPAGKPPSATTNYGWAAPKEAREPDAAQRASAAEFHKKKELKAKMDIVVQSLTYSGLLSRGEIISLLRGKKLLDGMKEAELEVILTKLVEDRKAAVQGTGNQAKWKRI